jgi:predicted membrane channel-forming protein YqfA (hemolysin III family)
MVLALCERADAPEYSRKDYPCVQRGFIRPGFKLVDAACTYFDANNETTNCWTQLIGLVGFLTMVAMVRCVPSGELINTDVYHNLTAAQVETRRFYYEASLLCVVACCVFSLAMHMFQAHSKPVHTFLSLLDWGGILLVALGTSVALDAGADPSELIERHLAGSFPAWLVYAIEHSTGPTHLFVVVAVFIGVIVFIGASHTTHAVRFVTFLLAVLVASGPGILISFIIRPWPSVVGFGFFLLGGFFFTTHVPERWYPRVFDIALSSHSLWHVSYQCALAEIFDTFSIVFFGVSPFTWKNFSIIACAAVDAVRLVVV